MVDNIRTVILIEDIGSIAAHERAQALSQKYDLPVYESKINANKKQFAGEQWQLVFTERGLVLRLSSKPEWGDIFIDFSDAGLQYRKQFGGAKKEPLVRATGLHKRPGLTILDCTAGMATDSFILASNGAVVTMLERQLHVALLLEDALIRSQDAKLDVVDRLSLVHDDASSYINTKSKKFDVIYLDPMFPHKKKSALVKKEMQAFQKLIGEDQDSTMLMSAALNNAEQRVVVKRPNYADPIKNNQGRQPDLAMESKKHRFDVYLIN